MPFREAMLLVLCRGYLASRLRLLSRASSLVTTDAGIGALGKRHG